MFKNVVLEVFHKPMMHKIIVRQLAKYYGTVMVSDGKFTPFDMYCGTDDYYIHVPYVL